MNAKSILFWSSGLFVLVGVAGVATLGAIAKVPSAEYWTVVLGAGGVGAGWLGLISAIHCKSCGDED